MELSKKINKLSGPKKKFLKHVVETSSPLQLIVLLYEGCLQWLHMAKDEINKNQERKLVNWSDYANYMAMAIEILNYLQDSLDDGANKDFSNRMFDLYSFMKERLFKANMTKEIKPIDEVSSILKDIKEAWKQASKQQLV